MDEKKFQIKLLLNDSKNMTFYISVNEDKIQNNEMLTPYFCDSNSSIIIFEIVSENINNIRVDLMTKIAKEKKSLIKFIHLIYD
jgi:hypothetical protein